MCDVVGSAVQVDREHTDRRAARVVYQPVQAQLSVRPPGTLRARLRHWRARVTSWVRPCRDITNTPIAALPESFGSLSNLYYLCVCRALCARGCGTCASGARWIPLFEVLSFAVQVYREQFDRRAARVVHQPVGA